MARCAICIAVPPTTDRNGVEGLEAEERGEEVGEEGPEAEEEAAAEEEEGALERVDLIGNEKR